MHQTLPELLELLKLEKLEENLFRGQNFQTAWKRVFGGQVLAQALHAAYQTVPEDRFAHSLHGYFILGGDLSLPIVYDVDTIRDGGSFTTRRVVAIQKGRAIFNMSASFCKPLEGFNHQIEKPDIAGPEAFLSDEEFHLQIKEKDPVEYEKRHRILPFEFRRKERLDPWNPQDLPPLRHIWMKATGTLPADIRLQHQVLAYMSDYNLMGTATLPHRSKMQDGDYYLSSLDHAMWFQRHSNLQDWHLFQFDSPSAADGRGFSRANLFSESGDLVASVVQEGLMVKRRK